MAQGGLLALHGVDTDVKQRRSVVGASRCGEHSPGLGRRLGRVNLVRTRVGVRPNQGSWPWLMDQVWAARGKREGVGYWAFGPRAKKTEASWLGHWGGEKIWPNAIRENKTSFSISNHL
jgi:hypothetical protein